MSRAEIKYMITTSATVPRSAGYHGHYDERTANELVLKPRDMMDKEVYDLLRPIFKEGYGDLLLSKEEIEDITMEYNEFRPHEINRVINKAVRLGYLLRI